MERELTILGISGSLREGSYNTATLRAAQELCPPGARIELFTELGAIPAFNQDLENDPPSAVRILKRQVREAGAILFATPEYNYSVPGVLKNAIDWASRPYGESAWDGKPAAIVGASTGMLGSARAQYHLRQMFVFLNIFAINEPEVMIPMAEDRFDDLGDLTDDVSRKLIAELLENLVDWTKKLSPERQLVGV
ncbi:MAG TPA: NADPH-dependent FMN reductase [Tepidiformaceae bacterium]|nr:NADPH-dependent FMN reductase [Tepidiformaceae bacterium]